MSDRHGFHYHEFWIFSRLICCKSDFVRSPVVQRRYIDAGVCCGNTQHCRGEGVAVRARGARGLCGRGVCTGADRLQPASGHLSRSTNAGHGSGMAGNVTDGEHTDVRPSIRRTFDRRSGTVVVPGGSTEARSATVYYPRPPIVDPVTRWMDNWIASPVQSHALPSLLLPPAFAQYNRPRRHRCQHRTATSTTVAGTAPHRTAAGCHRAIHNQFNRQGMKSCKPRAAASGIYEGRKSPRGLIK